MASTSNPGSDSEVEEFAPSTSISGGSFDVFINHRGADVRYTLAQTLYKFLTDGMGLKIFLDSESLELGDDFPAELKAAIESASLHIAIFSENYAKSRWCLEELLLMCSTGAKIVPIFYHVRPDDVRYSKGVFGDAFERHKKKGRYPLEKLNKWKDALHNVSNRFGYIYNEEKDEGKLLNGIAKCVLKVVKKSRVLVAEHPVGLDEIIEDFRLIALQCNGSPPGVQMVGIWGMGGSGKTTLAKKLYNSIYPQMEKASLIYDVRDAASKNLLVMKQKKLLEDLGFKGVSVDNVEDGKAILTSTLKSVRAFIVLDDVDHVDQLYALLPARDSAGSASLIGSGSLIIITTRELEVLRAWGISSIYKMKPLSEVYARKLFCWHAFSQESPMNGFEELVELFLKACSGSPLSLKVLGGQLCGKSNIEYWESQLQKICRIVPEDIKQRLKISYDALDEEEKEAFLDTACFFIGEKSNLAIEVWNASGWSGLYILEKLTSKCLVEINGEKLIRMHDHLRDLGREIANKQSPYRIWTSQQIIQVFNAQNGIGIRGIKTMSAEEFGDCSSHAELVVNTNNGIWSLEPSRLGLKFVVAHGCNLNRVISGASRGLAWLRWFNMGQRNLRSLIPLKNLRVLELYEDERTTNDHLRELWLAECDAALQLRELVISHCLHFEGFPKSIGCLKHLKKIVLISTKWMDSLPEEFCLLQSLEHLELCHCRLVSLPKNMGNLRNLRHLDLCGCENLGRLPDSCKELMRLQHLSLWLCYNVTFTLEIMKNMSKLEYLCFSSCLQLEELPCHIANQASLRELDLRDMEKLRKVPMQIGRLSKLTKLCVGGASLTSLPASLGDLSSLTTFQITFSPRLDILPDSLGRLSLLKSLEIKDSGIKSLPESISQLISLESLSIYSCQISELNLGVGSFSSSLCNLKRIHLLFNERLSKIAISKDCCASLEALTVEKNGNLTEIEGLPSSVRNLVISGCRELYKLPSLAELTSLQELELRDCYQVKEIQGLQHCRKMVAPSIQSLKSTKSLTVHLTAIRKSVVDGCIQSMQRWPREIIVCTKAVRNAVFVSSSVFPALSVIDCCTNVEISWDQGPKLVVKQPTNGNTIIVCFILMIPCMAQLSIRGVNLITQICGAKVEEGEWVWIGVFTQHSKWHSSNRYEAYLAGENGTVEKGFVAMVAEDSVMDAFRGLLGLMEI